MAPTARTAAVTTLPTGPRTERGGNRRRGFTLLELVLVMVVICTVLAMAAPSLRGFFAGRQTADAAAGLVALTQLARSQAVSEGTPYRLNLDATTGTYRLTVQAGGAFEALNSEFGRVFSLPQGVQLDLSVDGEDAGRSYVSFFPDGSTEPATITLTGRQGDRVTIRCLSPADSFHVVQPDQGGAS
jgi:general secretion pathway protein H